MVLRGASTALTSGRTLVVFLDGYEESLERALLREGALPHLARIRDASARFLLDYGGGQRTGLAGEHVSTGRSCEATGRTSAVDFDPATYEVWQEGTWQVPFTRQLGARTVVFDPPYFDLDQTPGVEGIVNWGAHDPGVPTGAQPPGLLDECVARFGAYPAQEWLYGWVWTSTERTRAMGQRLAHACDVRARAAHWLLAERMPDWELAIVAVSEPHSVIEGLWHGVDPSHPLHAMPSSGVAREGIVGVYRAVDRLIGGLAEAFPDVNLVVFSMGGMGPNTSDVPSMLLLPELAYRHAFGQPLFRQPEAWRLGAATGPVLDESEDWYGALLGNLPAARARRDTRPVDWSLSARARRLAWRMVARARAVARPAASARPRSRARLPIDWMPATRYQAHWPRMPFFALPSFYDGRIRVNLAGRERHGVVPPSRYRATCDEVEALLRECRDPLTGEGIVDHFERRSETDPRAVGRSEPDLTVVWTGIHCAIEHPRLGQIGPVPYRRPGGHTGRHGMAYVRGEGIGAGDRGIRSSFDVVPTICMLATGAVPSGLSGRSLITADG